MKSPLLEQFLTEGRELVEAAAEGLLQLEQTPSDAEIVNSVFRSVHTLKGNSGLFEYSALTELLHAAEELMVSIRDGSIELTPEVVDLLLASSDGVRVFLDEIDVQEALGGPSVEESRRLAKDMSRLLKEGPEDVAETPGASVGEGLPSWAEGLPASLYAPVEGRAVTLFEYRPSPTCFFRGEDPIQIVSQIPDVRWRGLILDSELVSEDPFRCALVLRGISSADEQTIRHALRYVEEEVVFAQGPTAVASPPEPPPVTAQSTAAAVVSKQLEVLDAWSEPEAPAVAEVLRRCFGALDDSAGLASLQQLESQPSVEALRSLVTAWQDRRVAPERPKARRSADEAGPESKAQGTATTSPVLRVDQTKIDQLMNLIGQLVVAKNGLPYVVRRLEGEGDPKVVARELKEHAGVVDRISRELQSAIMEVRMLPVSQVFQRFPRLVRDVSRRLDKQIDLEMIGEDTQADKNVIEALSEPLVHLVRNALDHGIEPPSERVAKGKPARGSIRLSARNENESVVISIEDDGKGIDPVLLREKAVKKGLLTEEDAARLPDEEARMLIFAAGFSTKEQASELSGRGVGMDVVRATIEKVGGRVALESEVGEGSCITLSLPLSMAVSHVMTVTADRQLYGIGMDSVVETVRFASKKIQRVKDREAFVLRERLITVVRLRELLQLPRQQVSNAYGEEAILVLRVDGETIGLVVDEFGENIEVLVRPLEGIMSEMREYSGSAVLGDGRLLLVLDVKELVRNGF